MFTAGKLTIQSTVNQINYSPGRRLTCRSIILIPVWPLVSKHNTVTRYARAFGKTNTTTCRNKPLQNAVQIQPIHTAEDDHALPLEHLLHVFDLFAGELFEFRVGVEDLAAFWRSDAIVDVQPAGEFGVEFRRRSGVVVVGPGRRSPLALRCPRRLGWLAACSRYRVFSGGRRGGCWC